MQAIVVDELGGPEVLRLREVPAPAPGPGEILVDISAAGVNFMDTGTRRAGPPGVSVPFIPGVEAAGTVRAVGTGVSELRTGDRVAWPYAYGSYAGQIVLPAASVMMQGLTAHGFATEAYPVRPGDVALVHAAAGGVGRLLTQLVKLRGGTVIGLVSRGDKAGVARSAGADHVVVSSGDQFTGEVMRLSGGGVHVVFDGGGETTFRASMAVLRRHGTLLYYGPLIGQVPTVSLRDLPGSIKISYPVFRDHIPTRDALLEHSAELFSLICNGQLHVNIAQRYQLASAAQAHRDLESRATSGKLLLLP